MNLLISTSEAVVFGVVVKSSVDPEERSWHTAVRDYHTTAVPL